MALERSLRGWRVCSRFKILLSHRLEQVRLPSILNAKVIVGQTRGDAAARSAVQESDLYQEGLINLFQGVLFFCQRGSQRAEAHRSAVIFLDDRQQQAPIH